LLFKDGFICIIELVSSESSESEEEIINIIYDNNKNHPKRKKPRVQNFIENVKSTFLLLNNILNKGNSVKVDLST